MKTFIVMLIVAIITALGSRFYFNLRARRQRILKQIIGEPFGDSKRPDIIIFDDIEDIKKGGII